MNPGLFFNGKRKQRANEKRSLGAMERTGKNYKKNPMPLCISGIHVDRGGCSYLNSNVGYVGSFWAITIIKKKSFKKEKVKRN